MSRLRNKSQHHSRSNARVLSGNYSNSRFRISKRGLWKTPKLSVWCRLTWTPKTITSKWRKRHSNRNATNARPCRVLTSRILSWKLKESCLGKWSNRERRSNRLLVDTRTRSWWSVLSRRQLDSAQCPDWRISNQNQRLTVFLTIANFTVSGKERWALVSKDSSFTTQ
jgi:hypothetical protein